MTAETFVNADPARAKEMHRFCRENEVELCILFGSRTIGLARADSDVDIALQFARGQQPSKLHLLHELEMLWMPKTVDLVVLDPQTDPLLLHEIFSHGKLIFEKSEGLFARARLRAWHLYLDTAPLRQKERQFILEKFGKGADVP